MGSRLRVVLSTVVGVAAGGVALAACAGTEASAPPPTTAGPADGAAVAAATPPPTPADHMRTALMHSLKVRDAIIDGDLEAAKAAAVALEARDAYAALPTDWKPWIGRVRRYAQEVTLAPDIPTAAAALSLMAHTCGDCHWSMRGGPEVAQGEILGQPEPGAPDIATRMKRHQVAVDELWLGLIKPSDRLWKQGTITLTRAEFAAPLRDGEPVEGFLQTEIAAVRDDAQGARAARTYDGRALSYGKLLSRCANCHAYVRR